MDQDRTKNVPPAEPKPETVDDEGLDEYDEEVAESFPASDPPASTHP